MTKLRYQVGLKCPKCHNRYTDIIELNKKPTLNKTTINERCLMCGENGFVITTSSGGFE